MAILDRRVPEALDSFLMSANIGLLWGTEDVVVPSPLRILRNELWLERAGLDLGLSSPAAQVAAFEQARTLADVSGIRYLLTTHALDLPELPLRRQVALQVGSAPITVRMYGNLRALPRAFAVGCTVPARGSIAQMLDAMVALPEPRGTALVEGAGLVDCVPGVAGTVAINRTSHHSLALTAEVPREAFLVVTETWYPGMEVRVDGRSIEPQRADVLFLGVPLSPGLHHVTVAYAPRHIYAAIGAAFLALVACGATAVVLGARSVRSHGKPR
jgi:hypothetical protein